MPHSTHGAEIGRSTGAVLHNYDRFKLDLAAILRSLRQLADYQKDKWASDECQKLLSRLAEDRFNLVVVGQFSRGKSSLMNAILGVDRLPTGVLPLTSMITTVSYADEERVLVRQKGSSLPHEIPLAELSQYVTQERNPGNRKKVELAEIQLPAELLRLGFHFIDTPGIGSAITENTRTTTEFLPEADAVIFVTSCESPLTEAEMHFLDQVRAHVRKIFLVVNKSDLISPDQRDAVAAFARDKIGDALGACSPLIFLVSARDGLEGKQNDESDKLAASGLPRLEQSLVDFLNTEKSGEFLLRVIDRTSDIMHRQKAEAEVARMLRSDRNRLPALEHQLTVTTEHLRQELSQTAEVLKARLRTEISRRLRPEIDQLSTRLRPMLTLKARQELIAQAGTSNWFDTERSSPTCSLYLDQAQAWLSEHRPAVERILHELTADDVQRLLDRASVLTKTKIEVGDRPEPTGAEAQSEALFREIPLAFRSFALPLSNLELPWWAAIIPLSGIRAVGIRRALRSLESFLKASEEQIVAIIERAAEDWIDRLRIKLSEQLESVATRQAEILRGSDRHDLSEHLNDLMRRLDAMHAALGISEAQELNYDAKSTLPLHDPLKTDVGARCSICVQLEKARFEFLRHVQYDLTVSDTQQMMHAQRGGFCSLHTWQYEAIASPQGVSIAYPAVLFLLAQRLHRFSQTSSRLEALNDNVRQLLADSDTCPTCRLLTSVERSAAKEIVDSMAGLARKSYPVLCLRHLYSVLSAKPDLEFGRLLVQEQARVLQRIGENMQRYALKHDALRRHLASGQEHEAWEIGLARLAGSRNVAAPWRVE